MPEAKTGFSLPPAAKPLNPMEMQQAFDTNMAKVAAVSDEDKKRYIRSLLGKEKFIKTYSLFGGNLSVSFKTRTMLDSENLKTVEEKDRYRSKLGISLNAVLRGKEACELTELDDVAYSAVCKAFNDFEEMCDEMYRRANDPDFWTGTGGRA
jgi:hypothetical protein